jgi:hypothetical protein
MRVSVVWIAKVAEKGEIEGITSGGEERIRFLG